MKTLIVYATKHGCAETCAKKLRAKLPGGADMLNLKLKRGAPLDPYDTVLIGGSIHAGRIQSSVKRFSEQHRAALLRKKSDSSCAAWRRVKRRKTSSKPLSLLA